MSQCPRGVTGPTKWRQTELCTASGGVEADEISGMHFIPQFPEYADFSLATLNMASSCTCREFAVAEFVNQTLTKEHWWVNAESARWIGHLIQQAQPQCCCCIGMQQRRRMAMAMCQLELQRREIQIVVIRICHGSLG